MQASLPLIIGIGALAAVPPLIFINALLRKREKDFDRSHLIDGTVIDLEFFGHRGKANAIVEYSSQGKTIRFNNHAHVPGAQVGDTVQLDVGSGQKVRVFTDINAKMVTVTATYMVLFALIGIGALGWHYLNL